MLKKILLLCCFCINLGYAVGQVTEDIWKEIESIEEILGDWKGVLTYDKKINGILTTIEIPVTVSYSIDDEQNYISVTFADLEQFLLKMVDLYNTIYKRNITIDEYWIMCDFKNSSENNKNIIYEKYTQKIIHIFPYKDRDKKFKYAFHYINQYKNKYRFYSLDDREQIIPGTETILTKY